MVAANSRLVNLVLRSAECNYLEDNFLRCLKEKSVKDEVPVMTCKVEEVVHRLGRFSGSMLSVLTDSRSTKTPSNSETSS